MNKYFRTTCDKTKDKTNSLFLKTALPCHHSNDKKALENYTTWLNERHAAHNKLGKKLCRQSGELLMNLGDEYNQVKEEKKALEYTRIPQKFDKYRGNPEWWEFPPGLHDKCTHRRDEVTYFYQKTEVQKNEIHEIEKVGVPGFIKNEKKIFPRTRNVYKQWQNSNYRKNRVKELSSLLGRIEPHKPDFDRLIVMGKNVQVEQEETQTIKDPIRRSSSGINEAMRKPSVYDSSLKCCLKINDVYFYENSQSLSTSRKFHVLFEYDVQTLPLQTQYIVFENVGRVTIRLTWHKMEKIKLFRDISKTTNKQFFCFDKNLLILVPGQIFNFPIWFQTNEVCTAVETWEITTIPKFWPKTIQVFFVLQAQTHIENFMGKIRTIKTNINHKVKWRIINEILEDLTLKSKYQDYKNIRYTYYEPELFEAMNFDDSEPVRKPKYLYDKVIVEHLKKFYAEMREPYHPKTWNLKVWDLQVMCRVKDLIEYAEIRTVEFSKYRLMVASRTELPEGKQSRSAVEMKVRRSKASSGSSVDDQSDLFSIKETKYGQLMKLLWRLAPPSIINLNEERVKYFQVYSIFCAYFTLISKELYQIKTFSADQKNKDQDHHENRQRLIFERFDDTQLTRTKRSLQEDINAQPKAEKISDVSDSDVHKMYRLYFASSETSDKDKSKRAKNSKTRAKQEETRKSKLKPSQLSSNLSRTTFEEMGLVNLDFDPYQEVLPIVTMKRVHSPCEDLKVDNGDDRELSTIESLNIHVITYNYLSKAVEAMVDALESAKEHRVPHQNLQQLKACFKLFIEEEEELEVKENLVNPFTNPEEREYFEKILRAHLNEVTGQYLICGKTEPVHIEHHPVTFWSGENQVVKRPEAPSIFTLNECVPDKISFEDHGVQTLPHTFVDDTSASHVIRKCPSDFRGPSSTPSDTFYYSDDEEFGHQTVEETNGISNSSKERIQSEAPKRKTTMSKAPISLIEEWNKKKCSRNELQEIQEMEK